MNSAPLSIKCNGRNVFVFPDRIIGEGGYSYILEGRDRETGGKLAVKAIDPRHNSNPIIRERARREGNELIFDHPNIVKMVGYAELNGNMFIVSEFIEGETLQEKLDRGIVFPEHQVIHKIILPLLDALEFLHNKSITHRDVKASNLLIEPNGNVRLIDMGISQLGFLPPITDPDNYPRTEHYASPEIIRGVKNLKPSTDLYSVGILLYQLFTNRLPFTHHNRYQLYQMILNGSLPHDNRIPPEMQLILHRLTRNSQEHRYQSVAELREVLSPTKTENDGWKTKLKNFGNWFFGQTQT